MGYTKVKFNKVEVCLNLLAKKVMWKKEEAIMLILQDITEMYQTDL